jgi:hypothetical protein
MLVCVAAAWRDMAEDPRLFIEAVCEVKYCMKGPVIVPIVISFHYAAWGGDLVDTVRDLHLRRHSQPWASSRQPGSLRGKAYVNKSLVFLLLKFSR